MAWVRGRDHLSSARPACGRMLAMADQIALRPVGEDDLVTLGELDRGRPGQDG